MMASFRNRSCGKLARLWPLLIFVLIAIDSRARVVRVEVLSRTRVAAGTKPEELPAFDRISARVYFAVRPEDAHNKRVVDLDKAPRNAQGEVEFSADLFLVQPAGKGNDALLLEIPNRGGKGILGLVDGGKSDPKDASELGDGWLLRQGFAVASLGWQWDVAPDPGSLRLYAPVAHDKPSATNPSGTIFGLLRDDFTSSEKAFDWPLGHVMGTRLGGVEYAVFDPNDVRDVLTVRDAPHGKRVPIPRSEWGFTHTVDGKQEASYRFIHLNSGFEAGKIYELVYVVKDPVVAGLGFVAVRDFAAWIKELGMQRAVRSSVPSAADAIAAAKFVYGQGISQCGRFLRDFLYEGFNSDESGRIALDGVLAHVGGAGRGSFNYRFAQPSRDGQPMSSIDYPTDIFPFTDLPEADPDRPGKARQGLLDAAAASHVSPKIFFSHTSYEYWGRAASLIHTSADGKTDATIDAHVRIYFYAGLQHYSVPFPPAIETGDRASQQMPSPLQIRWFWRAMIANMDAWVRSGTEPPASRYPKIADGTLVSVDKLQFPALPGVGRPAESNQGWDLDFGPDWRAGILSRQPPVEVSSYRALVPQVDADGNDLGGIRLPQIAVPLATYTGWNLRAPSIGAPGERTAFLGSFLPFRGSAAQALAAHDPRLPIDARYRTYAAYRIKLEGAVGSLVKDRYVLSEDGPAIIADSQMQWDWAHTYPLASKDSEAR